MGVGAHGAESGAVLGILGVFMAQQLGYLDLSSLWPAVGYLILLTLALGLLGGILGRWVASRAARSRPPPSAEEIPEAAPDAPTAAEEPPADSPPDETA